MEVDGYIVDVLVSADETFLAKPAPGMTRPAGWVGVGYGVFELWEFRGFGG